MNIGVLSRSVSIYSTYRIVVEGKKRGHHMRVIDHVGCKMMLQMNKPELYFGDIKIKNIDAIIPRIGSSVSFYGASVVQQFEMQGVYTTLRAEALLQSRNKLRSLQLLSKSGIGMPRTCFGHHSISVQETLAMFPGEKLIIKLLEGTQGIGVILAENKNMAASIIDAFNRMKKRYLIQEFIEESKGTDIRAFVIDGEVFASMKRQAEPGEFRSNLHRGGEGINITLTDLERNTAIKAAKILNLSVAGVDMLRSNRGPLIMEVNPSPGLEGIEKTTGLNIAGGIIEMVERNKSNKKPILEQHSS